MAQLIDKTAVVTELERLISNGQTKLKESEECKDYESYVALAERIATCINVLSFLDTIEVKEVDLEKEIKNYFDSQPILTKSHGIDYQLIPSAEVIAKHFFELGLKAQKGE